MENQLETKFSKPSPFKRGIPSCQDLVRLRNNSDTMENQTEKNWNINLGL